MAEDSTSQLKHVGIATLIFLLLVFIGSYIYYLVENVAVEGSYINSMFYVILTVTTVGTGYYNPLTIEGKILTIVMVMIGMGVVLYLVTALAKTLVEGREGDVSIFEKARDAIAHSDELEELEEDVKHHSK